MLELASEARADPARDATTVVIGIHPFVIGTPDGAAALRRVLLRLKTDDAVWLTDTDAILKGGWSEMNGQLHGSEPIEKVESPCFSLEPERRVSALTNEARTDTLITALTKR